VGQGGAADGTNGKRRRLTAERLRAQSAERRERGRTGREGSWYDQYPVPPCFCVRDPVKGLREAVFATPRDGPQGQRDAGKGVTERSRRPVNWRKADGPAIRRNGIPGKGGESGKPWGCTPGFLLKSGQAVGRTRDRCDPRDERLRKCLKTRRGECEKLVTRAGERGGEQDRAGVRTNRARLRTGLRPNATNNHSTGIVTQSIVNYMVLYSKGGVFELVCPESKRGRVKTRTLEHHKGAAPRGVNRWLCRPPANTRQRMDECSLPKARPISYNVCPAFQRGHTSSFCSAENPNRLPCFINTTFENSFIPDGVASTA
jgi:hypothetical protein